MTATLVYYLCMRRLGNRNKGIPGATFTNLTVDAGSGIITGLGTLAQLAAQDATYRANPTQANFPRMRAGVAAAPVAIAKFTLADSTTYGGDDKYRLAKILQVLNGQYRKYEENCTGALIISMDPIVAIQNLGFTSVQRYTSSSWPNSTQDNCQIVSVYYNSTDVKNSQGKNVKRYEYFVTNKTVTGGTLSSV